LETPRFARFRNIYGRAFAVGLPEHMRLFELFGRMEERGLWQVVEHFEDGSLARRIREAGDDAQSRTARHRSR
jgi:hypothetical protein